MLIVIDVSQANISELVRTGFLDPEFADDQISVATAASHLFKAAIGDMGVAIRWNRMKPEPQLVERKRVARGIVGREFDARGVVEPEETPPAAA